MQSSSLRVDPHLDGPTCTWWIDRPGLCGVGMWLEQRQGRGEDGAPTILIDLEAADALVAVYDGVGGAGSAPGRERPDGSTVSSAFLAARSAREATEGWFGGLSAGDRDEPLAPSLHARLAARLDEERSRHLPVSDRIAGSLRRLLPTTMAAARVRAGARGALEVTALWAGDSRSHLLRPREGLQVLTTDDTPTADALDALVNDAPMSNMVCADRPFSIHERTVSVPGPVVLLAATDGCFGYVATPAHFEHLILEALRRADGVAGWADQLLADVRRVAADDASLALLAVGWGSFRELQADFAARGDALSREHWKPFADLDPQDRPALVAAREASWDRYRTGYQAWNESRVLTSSAQGGDPGASG